MRYRWGRDRRDAATSQGHRELPEAGRGSKDSPLSLQRERGSADILTSDFWPPEL